MENPERVHEQPAVTYIDLTRHGNRFGGKISVTIDGVEYVFDDGTNLTPQGKQHAAAFGSQYPEEVALVHPRGGDEARHGETGDDIMSGTAKYGNIYREKTGTIEPQTTAARVRDAAGRVKGARRGQGVDHKGAGFVPFYKPIKECVTAELNAIVRGLSSAEQQQFLKDPEMRAQYREQAQVVGFKKFMNEFPDQIKNTAENAAYELIHVVRLSRRGVAPGEVKAIPVVGSGMFAESLFKYALLVEDEKTGEKKLGFDDVDEIGGFIKQATAFRMKLERDASKGEARNMDDMEHDTVVTYEFSDPERAKIFEGKKVSLDWNIVRQLARRAEQRFAKSAGKPTTQ